MKVTVFILVGCILFIILIFFLLQNIFWKESYDNSHVLQVQKFYREHFLRNLDPITQQYHQQFSSPLEIQADIELYSQRVQEGKEYWGKKSILLAGLIRNAVTNIPFLMKFYEKMKKYSSKTLFIIVENNSVDGTREALLAWAETDTTVIILCDSKSINTKTCEIIGHEHFYTQKVPGVPRISKLAYLRNIYLDYITENKLEDVYDYLFIKDLDLNGRLFIDGICQTMYFMKHQNWSAISCNGMVLSDYSSEKFFYYDSFAYTALGDPWEWDNEFDKQSHDREVLHYITKRYTHYMDLDPVFSSFGGFCIYSLEAIQKSKARYQFSTNHKLSCEHAHFHHKLQKIGKIAVNPRMIYLIGYNK